MSKPDTDAKGSNAMKPYRLDGSAAVTNLVTVLVSAWFVVAAGAILTDQHSEGTLEMAKTPTSQAQVTPDAHFTITVEARRIAS